ncbi:reverse transcriptase domain-containing protein [Tanacetum coccineum]
MDDEPMWAADHVVAPTPGFAITIPETANELAIKALFDRLLGEIRAFSQHENESLTDAWLHMKEMLRNCHGHNLSKGNIIKIFYHGLSEITPRSSECRIRCDDEDDEPTPQSKIQTQKPVKETSLPKPYKPKIPYPQRLRKEKIEAQYGKFLDMIRAVRINIPLVDVLAGMPNYGKFLKELIRNKRKIEQISAAFLSDESSAMIQNKVPPKLGDPRSFLIPCNFNKTFSCNALVDVGASINLMPYSLYAKLSLETLKPTKMSVRLADRSFQYPLGIAENMLVEVGKFTFLADFVILKMEEDIGTERMIFNIDSEMKHSYSNDDTCFSIDVIDEILEEDFDALLDEGSKILHSIEGTLLEEEIFSKFNEFIAMAEDENSESESDTEEPPFEKNHHQHRL